MKITYDNDADALYIKLKEAKVHKTKEVDENTILDYDKDRNLIGICIETFENKIANYIKKQQQREYMETVTIPKEEFEQMSLELKSLRNSKIYLRLLEFEQNILHVKKFTRKDLGF